eukprot:CAMPEP_0184444766 /NCGR_PEP_ID=MMETSP0740-20130409/1613_1 /TAXON_ID=385413 /ORGANISM="Thalassiosira miniscula, Strain CCMP1093" /LENGTH=72 /DNA_ID=CAMNT_0026813605 /DNA_START=112 /DNA_END=330 /DNA_ORIENTATION=-
MGRQGDDHLVINILPLWMVVPFLGPDRRAGHPAESIREIIELEGFDDRIPVLHHSPACAEQGGQYGFARLFA